MFKKLLSKVGIGSASIDLRLPKTTYKIGEAISGIIHVVGGSTEQSINDIEINLMVNSTYRSRDTTHTVYKSLAFVCVPGFTVHPNEHMEIPVTIQLPTEMPMSSTFTSFEIVSNLDIADGLDSSDKDRIKILPSGILANFISAADKLGLAIRQEGFTGTEQLFGFRATSWLKGTLNEVEFHYRVSGMTSQLTGFYEVEKRTLDYRADRLDRNERKGTYAFSKADLATPEIASVTIKNFIEKELTFITSRGV